MKVYFTCSARGTPDYGHFYQRIYDAISQLGHKHVSDYSRWTDPKQVYNYNHKQRVEMYDRSMRGVRKSNVVVLEVSTHSLSMGYVMQQALSLGKTVIALHYTNMKPAFAAGIADDKLQVAAYNSDNLEEVLTKSLKRAHAKIDVRFNFFISAEMSHHLDKVSRLKKIPRSVYLRDLIKRDIERLQADEANDGATDESTNGATDESSA